MTRTGVTRLAGLVKRRAKEPALRLSHLPPLLTSTFSRLPSWLHKRSAVRLLLSVRFATGRRLVSRRLFQLPMLYTG
jgi:hypothetical protein